MEHQRHEINFQEELTIAKILAREFGISDFNFRRLETGETHDVFKVNLPKTAILLKIVNNPDTTNVYKQGILQPILDEREIPIPRRLIPLEKIPLSNLGYVVDEWIEGEPAINKFGALIEENPLDQTFSQNLDKILHLIHSIKLGGYGNITIDGRGEFTIWSEFLESLIDIEKMQTIQENGLMDHSLLKRFLTFYKNLHLPSFESSDARLVHGDMNLKNILIRNSSIVGIVDWDDAILGDPVWDYARMHLWFDDRIPIFSFIDTDPSIQDDWPQIHYKIQNYKTMLAAKGAIENIHQSWILEAWSRLDSALEETGY